ncbi:MAG: glycoside hydrolase family 55 protein [Alphaproteobacteria bacterium]|nr:glycoside hydrolase family 55 protein [Alphaproteobacteria bacterium]
MPKKIEEILIPGQNVNKQNLRKYLGSREIVTPQDYGAYGDGIADDTEALNTALAENSAVFLPPGTYRTTAPIVLPYGRRLFGAGDISVIQAREEPYNHIELPEYPSDFNAVEIVEGYCTIQDIRIVGGATGIMLYGRDGPCVKNVIENVSIWDCVNGLTFDGWDDTDKPCYWNNASRVLIARPQLNGVLFTVTPGDWEDPETFGDSPNANKLHDVRVYSLSAPMSGSGFFVSAGRYNNSFIDCEANVHTSAEACFRLGFSTDHNVIVNFYAESLGLAPGVRIDNGSTNTSIVNLFSATGGAAIWDPTLHGEYQAYNAGFPFKNFLKDTWITDVHIDGMTRGTTFIDPPAEHVGDIEIDLEHTFYLLSSFNKSYDLILPNAGDAVGRWVTLKKSDLRENPITVKEADGPGPDRREVVLLQQFDTITLMSNGANWWILSDNRTPALSTFVDVSDYPGGVYEASMLHRVYLVSAFTAQIIFQLPAPSAAAGRLATIKKIDPSSHHVKIQMAGASGGPDAQIWDLTAHFAAMTIFSDGGQWVVLSAY